MTYCNFLGYHIINKTHNFFSKRMVAMIAIIKAVPSNKNNNLRTE